MIVKHVECMFRIAYMESATKADEIMLCRFFVARFPQLILTAFTFGLTYCDQEAPLSSYFSEGAKKFPFPTLAAERRHHQLFGSNENSTSWKVSPLYRRMLAPAVEAM